MESIKATEQSQDSKRAYGKLDDRYGDPTMLMVSSTPSALLRAGSGRAQPASVRASRKAATKRRTGGPYWMRAVLMPSLASPPGPPPPAALEKLDASRWKSVAGSR